MKEQTKTPILFIVFNRPDSTKEVFDAIRKIRPLSLYIAADGPRENIVGEKELCNETREIIANIDWPCETKTLFREKNLGCKIAVSSAITWFFNNVEQGIILEDDCLPNRSFFDFCELMLEKYKHEEKVMMVAGTNNLNLREIPENYFFSRLYNIWGWATWRRAWQKYDIDMQDWEQRRKDKVLKKMLNNRKIANIYKGIFDSVYYDKVNTWDTQWAYSCLFNNGLSVVPKYNLVTNIGTTGTHTPKGKNKSLFKPTKEFHCEFVPNLEILPDTTKDLAQLKITHPPRLFKNLLYKIYKTFK